jgi:DNA-binding PadR family transcriptional regulator
MNRTGDHQLLLGEWACLGILYQAPTHGFAIAARLRPDGDVGRVWSLTRPLTYRALDQLGARGFVAPIAEERGIAGPNRTVLTATRAGRARFRAWTRTPVTHLRDLRSELLLKLVLADQCGFDVHAMLIEQRHIVQDLADALADRAVPGHDVDVVHAWRHETSDAALRFLDRITPTR